MAEKKVVYYINQFFGNIGGEEKAHIPPEEIQGAKGPAMGFEGYLEGEGTVVATIICGDNYFNEHEKDAKKTILEMVKKHEPDLFVAGPAFNAGRYGMACGGVGKMIKEELEIPVLSGMYEENPGLEGSKASMHIVKTGDSAAAMRKDLPKMAEIGKKLLRGEALGEPKEEGLFPQGRRVTVFSDKNGAQRAVEMLMKRLKDEPYETELHVPVFDRVEPAAAIEDLSKATIALVCTGGILPKGNPDRIESASATKYGKYPIDGLDDFVADEYETVHGGYDPIYANGDPDRILPLDVLRDFEKEGFIGKVHDYFYTTVGTGTSVMNSQRFGVEIGKQLKEDGVDGVILTST